MVFLETSSCIHNSEVRHTHALKYRGTKSGGNYHCDTHSSQKICLQRSKIGALIFSWQIAQRSPAALTYTFIANNLKYADNHMQEKNKSNIKNSWYIIENKLMRNWRWRAPGNAMTTFHMRKKHFTSICQLNLNVSRSMTCSFSLIVRRPLAP